MKTVHPPDSTILSTYADLTRYAAAFAAGHLNFLLLLGAPGVGKSQALRAALGEAVCWLEGNVSALGLYLKAYEFRDQPIVLDDVDGLDRNGRFVRLLKSLCQSDAVKWLSWATQAHDLKRHQVPQRFATRSHLAVIANDWMSLGADVQALEDRAQIAVFAPANDEIHRHAATWFDDQEILDFVGDHLAWLPQLSLRTYLKARERKQAGLGWQDSILGRLDTTLRAVALLKRDRSFQNEAERTQAFVAAGHGSRSTYFKYARRLRIDASADAAVRGNQAGDADCAAQDTWPQMRSA